MHAMKPLLLLALLLAGVASAQQPAPPTAQAAQVPAASQAALDALLEGAKAAQSDALYVLHDGKVLLDHATAGGRQPVEMMSATKSVVALAIGRLVTTGALASVDEPVHRFYPEWKQGRKQAITVRMLMDHTSGLQNVPRTDVEIYPAPDFVRLALAAELDAEPGKTFSYNNNAVNLLAGIVEKASGLKLDAYLQRELFAPMGIRAGQWTHDKAGNPHAMSGLPLLAADAAKIGELVRNGGQWQGRRLLSAQFVEQMLAVKAPSQSGLLWWPRSSWQRIVARADAAELLRTSGVSEATRTRLAPLLARSYSGEMEIGMALAEAFGPDWQATVAAELARNKVALGQLFESEAGPVAMWAAEGYLGQHVIIVPEAKLVVVRQILEREDFQAAWNYPDILPRVLDLARTYAPSIPSGPAR